MESLFTVIALATGAVFFIWKLIAGWLIANLDVCIEAERKNKDDAKDWLAIKLLLKKGGIDGITIKDISIKIYDPVTKTPIKVEAVDEFNAFKVTSDKIDWVIRDLTQGVIRLLRQKFFNSAVLPKSKRGNPSSSRRECSVQDHFGLAGHNGALL